MSLVPTDFASHCTEILTIMANPDSYVNNDINISNILDRVIYQMIQKYKNEFNNKIEEKYISQIIETLKNIMPTDFDIDYSDLFDYFKTYDQLQLNPICNCYVHKDDEFDNYDDNYDNTPIKISNLFAGFHCNTCGHYESEHKVCTKYVSMNNNYWCQTCGLGINIHIICSNYNGIDGDCSDCGFNWHNHQDNYDQQKISDCGKFTEHPNCYLRCANCIFNKTHHGYSQKYHQLNNKTKSIITDLNLKLHLDFISMTKIEQQQYNTMLNVIMQLLTTI